MMKDLSEGETGKVLLKFTLPMFVGVIFQQLYNIADSVIAGKFAGEDALAAVGASYPITMIFMAVAIGSQIGCSVVVSKLFGAKEYDKVKTAVSTTMMAGLILSLVLTVFGLLTSRFFLKLLSTPTNIFEDGALYLNIYIGGFVFLFLYNVATGIFNSLGDSKTPLYLLICSSVGNVVLDLLFVISFSMGVAGVAWATFLAQGIAGVSALLILRRRLAKMETKKKSRMFDPVMLKKIAAIAVPSILQQSSISIGNLLIQGLINGHGSSVVAGYSAAIKLNTFSITCLTTLGNGVSSFTAQNIGAGKLERVRGGWKHGVVFAMCVSLLFFVAYFFFGEAMLGLFMNEESTVRSMETGLAFLHMVAPFYFVICVKLISDGVLRGSGSMNLFMTATFIDLILRTVLAFVFDGPFGTDGIWASWPIGWCVSMILSLWFYRSGMWKKHALAN
ncbi:MAG: MATE family efflux transporter [Lachnospiraceae bacterium]